MITELFPESATFSPSPRLRWMRRHDLRTHQRSEDMPASRRWCAWCETDLQRAREECGSYFMGEAATEEDALTQLAVEMRIPLWNEEAGI